MSKIQTHFRTGAWIAFALLSSALLTGCGGSGGAGIREARLKWQVTPVPQTYVALFANSAQQPYLQGGLKTYVYQNGQINTVTTGVPRSINSAGTLLIYPNFPTYLTQVKLRLADGTENMISYPQYSGQYSYTLASSCLSGSGNICLNNLYTISGKDIQVPVIDLNGTISFGIPGQVWNGFVADSQLIGAVGTYSYSMINFQNMKPVTTTDGKNFSPVSLPDGYSLVQGKRNNDSTPYFVVSSDYKTIYGNLQTAANTTIFKVCKWSNGLNNPPVLIPSLTGYQIISCNNAGDAIVYDAAGNTGNSAWVNQQFFGQLDFDPKRVFGQLYGISDSGVVLATYATAVVAP